MSNIEIVSNSPTFVSYMESVIPFSNAERIRPTVSLSEDVSIDTETNTTTRKYLVVFCDVLGKQMDSRLNAYLAQRYPHIAEDVSDRITRLNFRSEMNRPCTLPIGSALCIDEINVSFLFVPVVETWPEPEIPLGVHESYRFGLTAALSMVYAVRADWNATVFVWYEETNRLCISPLDAANQIPSSLTHAFTYTEKYPTQSTPGVLFFDAVSRLKATAT